MLAFSRAAIILLLFFKCILLFWNLQTNTDVHIIKFRKQDIFLQVCFGWRGLAQPQQPVGVAAGAGRCGIRCWGRWVDWETSEDGGGGVHGVQPGVRQVRSCRLGGIRVYDRIGHLSARPLFSSRDVHKGLLSAPRFPTLSSSPRSSLETCVDHCTLNINGSLLWLRVLLI